MISLSNPLLDIIQLMSQMFYLPRNLSSENKIYSEAELLATSNYVVILAEPGGGKTELMRSLAHQLGTTSVTASKFAYAGAKAKNIPLVIDAFDELSKVDSSGIYKLLAQAEAANPSHVYLSSRSSEWDDAATHASTISTSFPAPFHAIILSIRTYVRMEQAA